MASVASEVSAVHHARSGHGLRGNAQAASGPDAGGFGALLDGADDPAPAAAAPNSSSPPPSNSSSSQQGTPDPATSQAAQAAQTDPTQAPSQPLNPTNTQAGSSARPDDGKTSRPKDSAPGSSAPVAGKDLQPSIAAKFGAAANVDPVNGIAPPGPNSGPDATDVGGQAAGNAGTAGAPDQRAYKSGKTDSSDSTQAAAAPGSNPSLNQLVTPPPPPIVAVVANAPAVGAAAQDDDGAEIDQLAALGNAARPSRPGGQVDAGTDAAAADASAPGGQSDSTQAGPTASAGAPAGPSSAPDLPIRPGNTKPADPPSPPNAFAAPAPESFVGRMRAHATADTNAPAGPAHGTDPAAGMSADPIQPVSAPAGRILEAASAGTDSNNSVDHAQSPAAAPDTSSNPTAPASPIAPANAAAPTLANAPAGQPAAPASVPSGSPAVPIAGLAVAITTHALAGKNRFDIRLDPPDLGRIDVRLDVDHDGKVTSHLVVERQETLDVLRRDAPQIERSLQQAGLKTSDDALQFTLRDQSSGQQNPYPRNASPAISTRIVIPDANLPPVDAGTSRYGGIAGLGSGIDIRV